MPTSIRTESSWNRCAIDTHSAPRLGGRTRRLAAILAAVIALIATPGARAGRSSGVLRATLKNGLRVVIVRNPLAPVVTTEVNYLVGSNEAPSGFPGMAHAQEHMMFRGSPGLSANQLAYIGAAMGGDFDADTQQTVTQYLFTVPARDLRVALHIEAIRMRGVLDHEALWRRERGAIDQEVARDLSSPDYRLYRRLLARLFHGTPYAHDALGTHASFQRTTGAMLRKFHEAWYAPNNAILVIAGDVRPKRALRRVRDLFGAIPRRSIPPRPAVHLRPVVPTTLHLTTDRGYGLAVLAVRMPGTDSPDYAAAQVLADVLNSQRGNLYALVPEGKALSASYSMSAWPGTGLGIAALGFPRDGNPQHVVANLRHVLAGIAKHGVPADLVAAAKRRERAGAAFWANSIPELADIWSQSVAVEGRRSPWDDIAAIDRVTPRDVDRAARRWLDPRHAVIAVLTPKSSGRPVSGKGYGGKESFAPHAVRSVHLPEWARRALNRLTVPPSALHPVSMVLPNGLRLIVQRETVSPTVNVYGRVRTNADLEAPRGQEGVAGVLSDLFDYGTTHLGRLAFQRALDAIAAGESAGYDFSLQVLDDHFARGMQLLAGNLLNPALPPAAFKVVRTQHAAAAAGELHSPAYLFGRALHAALYPRNDPTLRQATPATIGSLTLHEVRRYYRKTFRPDLTTIVVIGKITPQRARAVVDRYFGSWKAHGPRPDTWLPPVPPNRPSITRVPDAGRIQDQVALAETLGLTRANPDYYALQLGNHVLGGGFYATRLYRDLRQERGLVYYVSSNFEINRTRGAYVVSYGCDPHNAARARAIVVRDLKQMQTTPVDPAELHRAKALALREIPLSEASVDDIGAGLLARAVDKLPLDEPTRAARRYLHLSAARIRAAYARWLRPGDLVQVTRGPPPR